MDAGKKQLKAKAKQEHEAKPDFVGLGSIVEFVYLVWTEDHVGRNPVYKIGRTARNQRDGYGAGSIWIAWKMVRMQPEVEKLLIAAFENRFKPAFPGNIKKREWFEGNVQDMYALFEEITRPHTYVLPFGEFNDGRIAKPLNVLPQGQIENTLGIFYLCPNCDQAHFSEEKLDLHLEKKLCPPSSKRKKNPK